MGRLDRYNRKDPDMTWLRCCCWSLAAGLGAFGPAAAWAQSNGPYYGPHMWGGGWWMFFGPLTMILFLGAIVALVVLLVRWLGGYGPGYPDRPPGRMPLDILKERFARGEIDKAEYEERRRVLGE